MASSSQTQITQISTAWASGNGALRRTIIDVNTTPETSNRASWALGFPYSTFQPVPTENNPDATGIPPSGYDLNQVLYILSNNQLNSFSGILPNIYDTSYQSEIGGYPLGAMVYNTISVQRKTSTANVTVLFRSLIENNLSVPNLSNLSSWELMSDVVEVYNPTQQINGNVQCWVRRMPGGMIMQGGLVPGSYNNHININLIVPYTTMQMGASITSTIGDRLQIGDNDPSYEILGSSTTATGDNQSQRIENRPMGLTTLTARLFRAGGSNRDMPTVIWTSWGI